MFLWILKNGGYLLGWQRFINIFTPSVCYICNGQFVLLTDGLKCLNFVSNVQEEMFKGDRKAKNTYCNVDGAGMLSNEIMVGF